MIRIKKVRLTVIAVILVVLFSSCSKVDFQSIERDKPYVGLYQGKDCAVVFDQAEEGNVKGRIYVDKGMSVAEPVSFTCDLNAKGKGKLWVNGSEKKLKKVSVSEDVLKMNVDGDDIVLNLSEDVPVRQPMYRESIYGVSVEKGRVYAKQVKGYWSSYPDTEEEFSTIYLAKVKNLLSLKDLDLDMDVYYPQDIECKLRHPLLVLIHGGAFYNGDKSALGYPEMGNYFAERGYVVASINYRLGFKVMPGDIDRAGYRALQDAHAAVCYLIQYADEYGIDTNCIFVAGSSAGGITALNLAYMQEENRPDATRENGVSKMVSTVVKTIENWTNKVSNLFGVNMEIDENNYKKLFEGLGLDSDLGPINAVSGPFDRPFQVKAVVNMWGAVHTLEMLNNSPQTDLLSFHGDADHIVPYEYGYPFDKVLEPYWKKIFDGLPSVMKPLSDMAEKCIKKGKPLNEWVFHPMHGSKAIHDKVSLKNAHNELFTCKGGGHSLHEREYGCLSDYFSDTIIPNMNRFLCESIVGGKLVRMETDGPDSPWYKAVDTDKVSELYWLVEGGVVVRTEGNDRVKVMFFSDAPSHSVQVCGKYANGVEFRVGVE